MTLITLKNIKKTERSDRSPLQGEDLGEGKKIRGNASIFVSVALCTTERSDRSPLQGGDLGEGKK